MIRQQMETAMFRSKINAFFALVLILGLCLCLPAARAEQVTVTGSTSLLPLAQSAAEAYMNKHPQARISVAGRGSADGARSILDKTSDLAGASRELKPIELSLAKSRHMSLVTHPVALGCVVPVVDHDNPLKNITMAQLKDIYSGKIKNWSELGGPDRRIAVMTRDSNSGTQEVFKKVVMKRNRIRPDALMLASNGAMVQAVAGNRAAIGFVSIAYLEPRLKALTVDGLKASPANVKNGKYPLKRMLYLLTAGQPSGETKRFLDFLKSPEVISIIQKEGFIPLPAK